MGNKQHVCRALVMMLIMATILTGCAQARVATDPTSVARIQISPGTDITHPDRSGLPNRIIDSRMDRRTVKRAEPNRFASDGIIGTYMACQRADKGDMKFTMFEAVSSECAFTYAISAGDLNGDGRDDALVFNGTYNSTAGMYTFEYVSVVGGDGTELWGQSIVFDGWWIDDIPAIPVDDLDGDGKRDVIVISGSYDSTTNEYTASVDVRRGYDGNIIWSQSVTGEDAGMYAIPCGDIDGDGKEDVIVNPWSYDPTTDEYTDSIYVKRGYDGYEFWSQSVTAGDGLWAYSCGDLDCDGRGDVIVNPWSYDPTTDEYTDSIHAKRGYDGHEFWSQSVVGEGAYMEANSCGDLDGDGKEDVIVESESRNSTTDEYTGSIYAKRGYDGHEFWSQIVTGGEIMWVSSCDDLDFDDKLDVIVLSRSYDSATDVGTASVHVKRGYDGHEFWSQNVTSDGMYSTHIWAFPCGDLDSDGKSDMVVSLRSYDSATDEYTESVCTKRGYDGHEFWIRSVAGEGAAMWASTCCDIDSDGKGDVIVKTGNYDSVTDKYTAGVDARRGHDGNLVWSYSIAGDGRYGSSMWASSCFDMNGDGRNDVIIESESYDSGTDETTCTAYAKRGYDGAELWSQSIAGKDAWMGTDYYNWDWWHQDFDGDNLYDPLIATGISIDYVEVPTKVCAVKGSDGTSLWCRSSSEPPTPPLIGDLNGDGKITPADAMIVLDIIVSGGYSDDADVNDDGMVNSLDALMITQAARGVITL